MIPTARAVAAVMTLAACTGQEAASSHVSLVAMGDSLYARGAFDSAAAVFTRVLEAPGTRGSPGEARALANLGAVAYRQGDYATARRHGDSALALKERFGLAPRELAESRNVLGLVAWNEGRLSDATVLFLRAMAEYDSAGDRAGVAKASSNLGLIALEYGRFAEARQRFAAAKATARTVRDARIEGRATTNLAMIELWSGDPRSTIPLVAEARALAREAKDPVNEENALGQLALGWAALGEPGRALATIDSAFSVARRYGLREAEANDLMVAAGLYLSAGDLDRALRDYASARALYDTLGLPVEAATVQRHESVVRALRGAVGRSQTGLERALATHRANEARFETFLDRLALARMAIDVRDLRAADLWLDEAARDTAMLDGPHIRVAIAMERARLHDARGDARQALATIRSVSADLELADAQSSLEADWLRTRSHAALGQLDSAVASARRAAAAIDRVGSGLSSLALRVAYSAERHRVVADIVLTLLRVGAIDEAFRIAESGRGQALRAQLGRARADLETGMRATTAAAFAERERLLREIDELVARLAAVERQPRAERGVEWPRTSTELTRRIREARSAYEALVLRQGEAESDPRRQAIAGMPTVDASAVRAALRKGEAIIEYFPTRDTLVVFALTRDRTRALTVLAGRDDIEQRVRLVRGLLTTPGHGAESRAALDGLHTLLVQPLEHAGLLVGIERLLLVPHGALVYLPYPALRSSKSGRMLAEDFVLQRLPAAALLPALRQNLATPSSDRRTAVFAPFPERLPATRVEATALARFAPNASVYRSGAATEARLRQSLTTPGLVHVASHATFNGANPMFSGIVLARGRGESKDDGRLELHEVLGLPVRSTLVFLSGCETGLGAARVTAFDRPEDAATLGDALLLSGAGGVVATLWRIDDEGAAELAQRFYRQLARREPAEALALAQRELLASARWGDPYYWASYLLSGDGM
jgi:CHAT domain-containing protein